jgi:HlyD family secretion protein
MKRNVLIIGIVIVVLAVAGFFVVQQQNAANAAAATVRAQTATVRRGTLVATIAEAGNVSAPTTASVAFQVSGRVAQVNVQVGDKVKAGQVLMTLDPSDLQLALKTAQTNLANAQANLDSAKLKASQNVNQLIVAKMSLDKATVALQQAQAAYDAIAWQPNAGQSAQAATLQNATSDYQSALANYNITASSLTDNSALRTAQAQVDQAQIAVTQAQDNLDKTKLVSPINGTVSAVNYNVGDTATGTAVVVADLSQLQIKVTAAEIDISNIKVGQTAQVTLDALPGKTYTATITAINPVGTVTSGVVNYQVISKLSDPNGDILPGMTANLAIEVARRDNVLVVPLRAIKTQGNQKIATVLYKGQQITVPVTTGLSNDTQVEVTSGLQEGDEVVIGTTTTTQPRGGFGGGFIFRGD